MQKKAAIVKYTKLAAVDTRENVALAITEEYPDASAEEVNEIVNEIYAPEKIAPQEPGIVSPPSKAVVKSKYPLYDLWKVDMEPLVSDKSGDPKKVRFTAIKKLRSNVKLEDHLAAQMNTQSHNSRRRYYPAESITNGNDETITIQK